jgi:transposase-like protein
MRKALPRKGRKGQAGRRFSYDFSFMRMVVQSYIDGNESMVEIAKRFDISKAKVGHWVERHRKGLEPFNEVSLAIMSQDQPQQQDNQTDLQKQNEELLKKLEQANLKITGLEIMIDIAEEQLGVDIRKNSGAKQSKDCANTTQEQA